jgi:hypothetical protein
MIDVPESVVHLFHNGQMLEALERLRSAAIDCADAAVWPLSDTDVVACLDVTQQASQALAAVELHLIRQADSRGLPAAQHATSAGSWVRRQLRVSHPAATRLVTLSQAMDHRPGLDQALTVGAVNLEQADVIVKCLDSLPTSIGAEAVAKAEAILIGWAAEFGPRDLKTLADRILEHVAPEIAEAAEAAALDRLEKQAHQKRTLSLDPIGDGQVRIRGLLDAEAAAIVSAALDPLCAPRHTAATPLGSGSDPATADSRDAGQRRADALVEVCRLALNTGDLPVNGGDRPQVTVTVAYDPLRAQLGVGTLDTGERLSPAATRRLACDAQILPAVLGGESQVLDVGQSRRLFTGPLRRALVLRDGGCAFPDCERPPRWCDGHHIRSWIDGGPTSLDNAVLLCGLHHRAVHHDDWHIRLAADGLPEFIPPKHVDPDQHPRRNRYHHRT